MFEAELVGLFQDGVAKTCGSLVLRGWLVDQAGEFGPCDWLCELDLLFPHSSSFSKGSVSERFTVDNPHKAGVFGDALLHLPELHGVVARDVRDSRVFSH